MNIRSLSPGYYHVFINNSIKIQGFCSVLRETENRAPVRDLRKTRDSGTRLKQRTNGSAELNRLLLLFGGTSVRVELRGPGDPAALLPREIERQQVLDTADDDEAPVGVLGVEAGQAVADTADVRIEDAGLDPHIVLERQEADSAGIADLQAAPELRGLEEADQSNEQLPLIRLNEGEVRRIRRVRREPSNVRPVELVVVGLGAVEQDRPKPERETPENDRQAHEEPDDELPGVSVVRGHAQTHDDSPDREQQPERDRDHNHQPVPRLLRAPRSLVLIPIPQGKRSDELRLDEAGERRNHHHQREHDQRHAKRADGRMDSHHPRSEGQGDQQRAQHGDHEADPLHGSLERNRLLEKLGKQHDAPRGTRLVKLRFRPSFNEK